MSLGIGLAVGSFVQVASEVGKRLGIGQVTELVGNRATVTYFDVPDEVEPFRIEALVSGLRAADLAEQTRVFRRDEITGRWQVGRILDGEGPSCLVAFPNGQTSTVARTDLRVRWRRPIANPVDFMARFVNETPRFAERGTFALHAIDCRSACGVPRHWRTAVVIRGVSGLPIRRCSAGVLQDPVQRYLLADEVGLGKTVEAALLVRQQALDLPEARALIVVPAPLVTQWRQELGRRFGLADWLDDFVFVVSSDQLDTVTELLPTVGMLVVDEAHHLSRETSNGSHPLYDLLRRHASIVPRLLLLSATPVLSDTAGFLRILHLLDPLVFPLDDLSGFERRLKSRQVVAELAALSVPRTSSRWRTTSTVCRKPSLTT